MPKEFMLYIKNGPGAKKVLNEDQHLRFIRQCENYITELQISKQLIAAQPLMREGFILKKSGENWEKEVLDTTKEIQVGYYHISADSIEDAIEIAKRNPEFVFITSASIEVRPVKTAEAQTNFEYPK